MEKSKRRPGRPALPDGELTWKRKRPLKGERPPGPMPGPAPERPHAAVALAGAKVARRAGLLAPTASELRARAQSSAEALSVLTNRPELRFLDRAERLAWLCAKVAAEHVETKALVVNGQTELVEVPTEAPQFKAMDMLMRALGDYDQVNHPAATTERTTVVVAMHDLHEELGRRLAITENTTHVQGVTPSLEPE